MKLPIHGEREATRHLAQALGLPFVDTHDYTVSPGILSKLPVATVVEYRCVPMIFNSRRVVLLLDDPARAAQLAAGAKLPGLPTDRPLEFALTTPSSLHAAILRRQALNPSRSAATTEKGKRSTSRPG